MPRVLRVRSTVALRTGACRWLRDDDLGQPMQPLRLYDTTNVLDPGIVMVAVEVRLGGAGAEMVVSSNVRVNQSVRT